MPTKISWCDETINPFVGCSKCSPGCDNCYAERMAMRMVHNPKLAHLYRGTVDENGWTGEVNFNKEQLKRIATFKRPRKIFIGSMCDIAHENAMYYGFVEIVKVMAAFPQHTFIMLTKRPGILAERMSEIAVRSGSLGIEWPLKNLWIGVTVCNQQEAVEKINKLASIPAAKHFVSVEPMLEKIDLINLSNKYIKLNAFTGNGTLMFFESLFTIFTVNPIDWVICGGETGTKARPVHPGWVRSLRDQCINAKVPFFFKSWGRRAGEKRIENLIDGVKWEQFPEDDNA